jgi:hypothetical protein
MNAADDTELKIEVVLRRSPDELNRLRAQLPSLEASFAAVAEQMASEALKNYQKEKGRLVEYFLQGAQLQPLDVRKARLTAEAMRRIFSGTEWLTAEQVGTSSTFGAGPVSRDPQKAGAARANRWKNEGRIFAIQRDGKDWYPRYQFDEAYIPLPAVKTIIKEFGDAPPIEIAGWMESPNNYLDAKRPRELVRTEPGAVLQALGHHFNRTIGTPILHD